MSEPMVSSEIAKICGRRMAEAVAKMDIRKRALEMAVAAAGQHSPNSTAKEISDKIETLADNLFAYMTKDQPDFNALIDHATANIGPK